MDISKIIQYNYNVNKNEEVFNVELKQTITKKDLVKKLLKQEIDEESEAELIEMLIDKPITIDVDKQEDKSLTRGEKLADRLSEIAGSWRFIIGFSIFIIIWIIINSLVMKKASDPYIIMSSITSSTSNNDESKQTSKKRQSKKSK